MNRIQACNRSRSHEKRELRSRSHTHENQEFRSWSRSHVHEKSAEAGAVSLLQRLRSPGCRAYNHQKQSFLYQRENQIAPDRCLVLLPVVAFSFVVHKTTSVNTASSEERNRRKIYFMR